jgi:hypothetical protein
MSLSKPVSCNTCSRKLKTSGISDEYTEFCNTLEKPGVSALSQATGATAECIRNLTRQTPGQAGIITTVLIGAVVIGGAFAAGMAAGLFASGRQNRTSITQIINQSVTNSFKTTLEQMFCQNQDAKNRAGNTLNIINRGSGTCNFSGVQKVDQYVAMISELQGQVKNDFANRALTQFTNDVSAKMGGVTDPISKLVEAIGSDQTSICQQINQNFRNTIETLFKLDIRQMTRIEQQGRNEVNIICEGSGTTNVVVGQEIIQQVISQQTLKIVSENISRNDFLTTVYNKTGGEVWEFQTGFLIAIVAILLILLFIYIYLKNTGIF